VALFVVEDVVGVVMKTAKEWAQNAFSARFVWWIARTFLFPALSLFLLCLLQTIDGVTYKVWPDIILRPEIAFVAISACSTSLYDLLNDNTLWPSTRRAVASFSLLLIFDIACAAVYAATSIKKTGLNPDLRTTIVGWTVGITFFFALFVELVMSPFPSNADRPNGAAK
jgi:hypothetical protein